VRAPHGADWNDNLTHPGEGPMAQNLGRGTPQGGIGGKGAFNQRCVDGLYEKSLHGFTNLMPSFTSPRY